MSHYGNGVTFLVFSHHIKRSQSGIAHDLQSKCPLGLRWYVHMLQWSARHSMDFNTELVFTIILYDIHFSHEVTANYYIGPGVGGKDNTRKQEFRALN